MSKNKREQKNRFKKFRGKISFAKLLKRIDRLEDFERMAAQSENVIREPSPSFSNDTDEPKGYWPDILIDLSMKKYIKMWAKDRLHKTY